MKTFVKTKSGIHLGLFAFLISGISIQMNAQDNSLTGHHQIGFNPGFVQIKDAFNYGLVNKGLDLEAAYRYTKETNKGVFSYHSTLGLGMNYRRGIGIMWSFRPVDVSFGYTLVQKQVFNLRFGPYLSATYHWQIYPELQSGQLFWRSAYEIGPRIQMSVPIHDRIIMVTLGSAVASLGSRPLQGTEEYYYSMTVSDIITFPHQNMRFGFQDLMNHIEFNLDILKPGSKFNLGYRLDYRDYLDDPDYKCIIHSICMNWRY